MFRSSGVLDIPILSIPLLECLPAWPNLLNRRWISKPVCLFTTWLGEELSSAKIILPDFSFKLRIDQGRKLKHIKAEKRDICSEKIRSLFSCVLSLSAALTDCCFSDSVDAWIDSKADFTKFVLFKPHGVRNRLLFLKIQASNEIIWFEMQRKDQRTPRWLSLLNALHVSLSRNRPIAFYASSLQVDHL